MKTHWLNKKNNKRLIVFFAGWSFDYKPFTALNSDYNDILFVYDYNDLEQPEDFEIFDNYEHKTLIAWSMGVFVANLLKDKFIKFNNKIAINGTINPVDDEFGIPVKIFELTLKHAAKGLESKFYQNIFQSEEEHQQYLQNPVARSIQNRVSELENLYKLVKNHPKISDEKFYDFALVSEFDKIIPPNNQTASHKKNKTPIISIPYGHNPFYKFNSWDKIILCKQTIEQ